jgi:hypothetical protein
MNVNIRPIYVYIRDNLNAPWAVSDAVVTPDSRTHFGERAQAPHRGPNRATFSLKHGIRRIREIRITFARASDLHQDSGESS